MMQHGYVLGALAGLLLLGGVAHGAMPPLGVGETGPLTTDNPQQVRIEQHFSIRISPGGPMMPPDMMDDLMDERPERFEERPMGRCFAAGAIAGVQSAQGNRLLLFMRDQHIVSAILEKACRARDFYSGFYVERSPDGMICANRDRLQSRSGYNCRIVKLHALVALPWRRYPKAP
ncbi:MAG: hypothetical protein KGJ57_08720 [Sphingomonadales bacterium]|nr:hypothetical protein [Sphingomonadales bacterium]MDE2169493.1 hypothetical protein [Sphingomonadales bacterium]